MGDTQTHRRQLRNYLIDPKLQLRYTLIMVMLSSLLTAGLGFVWYSQMRENSMSVEVKALGSMEVESADIKQLHKEMRSQDNLRLLALVGFGMLFALVIAVYGIILTHRIAGPLHKIRQHMADVRQGALKEIWDLRKADQLHEFFSGFKDMHSAIRAREQAELQLLEDVIEAAEAELARLAAEGNGRTNLDKQLRQLRSMRDEKHHRLTSSTAKG